MSPPRKQGVFFPCLRGGLTEEYPGEPPSPRPRLSEGEGGKNETRIYLIGPRGSGKSVVGWSLAHRLGWSFCDTDAMVEAAAGQTIRGLFEREGEAAFRDRECAALAEAAHLSQAVIATGGGIVLRDENRERMRATGRVVWLTADPGILWQRIRDDATTVERRPALTAFAGEAEVRALAAAREPLYRALAEREIDTAGQTPEQIAAILAAWIGS